MGQSTDAKLWYGACWTEEDEKYYESGLPDVVRSFVREKYPELLAADDEEENLETIVTKILEPYGCELVSHCHFECTMYGVAVKACKVSAWRGNPIKLDLQALLQAVAPDDSHLGIGEHRDQLLRACEAIGWPITEPGWWLASYWG